MTVIFSVKDKAENMNSSFSQQDFFSKIFIKIFLKSVSLSGDEKVERCTFNCEYI